MSSRLSGYRLDDALIFEKSRAGHTGYEILAEEIPDFTLQAMFPEAYIRSQDAELPEVPEVDVVRHYTNLSKLNHSVDNGFYPLGSCTMKYNPKLNEAVAALEGFQQIHPYQPESSIQGALALMYALQEALKVVSGMDAVTLQPAAGAHGEYTGMRMIYAYHQDRRLQAKKSDRSRLRARYQPRHRRDVWVRDHRDTFHRGRSCGHRRVEKGPWPGHRRHHVDEPEYSGVV